jgi:hypothetical protein
VALYLDQEKVDALRDAAQRTGRTQQELLREAVDDVIQRYQAPRTRAPRKPK